MPERNTGIELTHLGVLRPELITGNTHDELNPVITRANDGNSETAVSAILTAELMRMQVLDQKKLTNDEERILDYYQNIGNYLLALDDEKAEKCSRAIEQAAIMKPELTEAVLGNIKNGAETGEMLAAIIMESIISQVVDADHVQMLGPNRPHYYAKNPNVVAQLGNKNLENRALVFDPNSAFNIGNSEPVIIKPVGTPGFVIVNTESGTMTVGDETYLLDKPGVFTFGRLDSSATTPEGVTRIDMPNPSNTLSRDALTIVVTTSSDRTKQPGITVITTNKNGTIVTTPEKLPRII